MREFIYQDKKWTAEIYKGKHIEDPGKTNILVDDDHWTIEFECTADPEKTHRAVRGIHDDPSTLSDEQLIKILTLNNVAKNYIS